MKKSLNEFLADIRKGGKAKRVCSYCNKVMEEGPEDNITHGICEPCATKMLWMKGASEKDLTEFNEDMNPKYTPVGGGR